MYISCSMRDVCGRLFICRAINMRHMTSETMKIMQKIYMGSFETHKIIMDEEDDLYDEFGNLIGDPNDSDAESSEEEEEEEEEVSEEEEEVSEGDEEDEEEDEEEDDDNGKTEESMDVDKISSTLVKHTLSSTFGPGVETIISRPTDEMVDEPVIKPTVSKTMKMEESTREGSESELGSDPYSSLPDCIYSRKYMIDLANLVPERIRNVALIGGLHSGKTTFIDSLVLHTHSTSIRPKDGKSFKPLRFTDNHKLEIDRGISIKANPITLLLSDLQDKSLCINIIDTPGHPNFIDESISSLHAVDGVVYVVDVVEGLKIATDKRLLEHAIRQNLPITVVLNKIDRLILELRLPVHDAFFKIRNVLDQINEFIADSEYIASYKHESVISPVKDNVVFASSTFEFCFNLASFAEIYMNQQQDKNKSANVDFYGFVDNLWGDIYYNHESGEFINNSQGGKFKRSFNSFILEPLYKIFTYTITADSGKLSKLLWNNFKVKLHKSQYTQDVQVLLKDVCRAVFTKPSSFVSMIEICIPSPISKISGVTGYGHITKLIENSSGDKFYALVRIFNGKLKNGSQVKILGENFLEDDEDQRSEVINELYISGGRYLVPVEEIGAGNIVLVGGIDSTVTKGATILFGEQDNEEVEVSLVYSPPRYDSASVFKIAIEPSVPSQLPSLLEGFRMLNKSYLSCVIKVEESGEHVILAPGELFMDCMLHDLRHFFTDNLELKVSDPMTKFSETCIDSSVAKINIESANGFNLISVTAEPVNDPSVTRAIEIGDIRPGTDDKELARRLRKEFSWDSLASRSLWCFSSATDNLMPNILMDDTLDTNKALLSTVKDSISLAFKWTVDEGPLCDELIRGTKFKILDATLSDIVVQRNGTQIIPMTRKACYAGFMTATPKLMEPVYSVLGTCTSYGAVKAINRILSKRRGKLILELEIPGTIFFNIEGRIPVIESVGLESDIRLQTQGQAMVFLEFRKWDLVPGNPLDTDCFLPALRPVPTESLARDFVMKTRKRKGLSGEPNLQKFINKDLYEKLKESGLIG